MENIKVSVIVPVYNTASYLHETFASIFNQDMPPELFEVIAIDDGSTDDSGVILDDFAGLYPNFQVFHIENTGSAAAPRNVGLDQARGEYVLFVDSDDRIEPETVREAADLADRSGSGVVLLKTGNFGKRSRPLSQAVFAQPRLRADFIDSSAYRTLAAATKLFRKKIIDRHKLRFPTGYAVGEDQPFAMAAYLHSPHISTLSDKVYYWVNNRGDGTNVTSQGQSAVQNFQKNKNLIEVILANTEPGDRRDTLLLRPVYGRAGLRHTLGGAFHDSFSETEQADVVAKVQDLLKEVNTAGISRKAEADPRVLVDLALVGHVVELRRASALIAEFGRLPLTFDQKSQSVVYRTQAGLLIKDLNPTPATSLDGLDIQAGTLRIRGAAGLLGITEPADKVELIWRHRGSRKETSSATTRSSWRQERQTVYIEFDAELHFAQLKGRGAWDAFIDLQIGTRRLRERFGSVRAPNVKVENVAVERTEPVTVFFTKQRNLSIDVGSTMVTDISRTVGAVQESNFLPTEEGVYLVVRLAPALTGFRIIQILPRSQIESTAVHLLHDVIAVKVDPHALRVELCDGAANPFVSIPITAPAKTEASSVRPLVDRAVQRARRIWPGRIRARRRG